MDPVILVAIIGFAGILVSSVVGPLVINYFNNKRADRKEAKARADAEAQADKEAVWQERVVNYIKPVAGDVQEVKDDIKSWRDFMILDLRVNMKLMRDRVVDLKIPADTGEESTFKDLYKKYYLLGGNNFHDYVDKWGKEFGLSQDELDKLKIEVEKELKARENKA